MTTRYGVPPLIRLLGALLLSFTLLLASASAAQAQARISASKTSGLTDGDQVTVTGSGFTPGMTQIAVGQCIAEVSGPAHCHLTGGALFVNADDNGDIPSVTLTIAERFNEYDCTQQQCVVGAQILPGTADDDVVAANTHIVNIDFASNDPEPDPDPEPEADADGDDSDGEQESTTTNTTSGGNDNLAQTGPGDELPVAGLWSTALLMLGLAALLFLPRRTSEVTR